MEALFSRRALIRVLFSGFIVSALGSPILAAFALFSRLVDLRSPHGSANHIDLEALLVPH
jgi:hypothetical protein